jgi:hypothetical protein
LLDFPAFLELEEKRVEERVLLEFPKRVTARIRLTDSSQMDRSFELKVIDTSSRGLGLLVKDNALDLIAELNKGDRIPEIVITSTAIRIDAVVKHKTKIEAGEFKGDYILGLETAKPHPLSTLCLESSFESEALPRAS